GIWLGYNPRALTASAFVEQHQNAVRALNVTMPLLGANCVALTIAHAFLVRVNRKAFLLLLFGAALFVAAGLITRFGNQPINAIVMTWQASAPPPTWTALRDTWWRWHVLRTVAGIAAFMCVVGGSTL